MKKAEAYIDTVVTVFLNLLVVYVVMSLFSYMITYQKLNSVADNIIRCAAISGTTDDEVIGDKIDEYITDAGFDCTKVTCSFNGTEYMSDSTKNVQFGDTVILNLKTKQTYKFIGKSGVGIFNISVNKIALSEKYHTKKTVIINQEIQRRNNVILEGGIYTINATGDVLRAGDSFPDAPATGDTYEEGDYIYTFVGHGWHVAVKDRSKAEYEEIISEIAGRNITSMTKTFYNCTSLVVAPKIPYSVVVLSQTFRGCSSLTVPPKIPNGVTDISSMFSQCSALKIAPEIPSSVKDMKNTFCDCHALVTAPIIPDNVTNMFNAFSRCTHLTGVVTVNANPTSFDYCFGGTKITGINGSCSQETKDALMSTK